MPMPRVFWCMLCGLMLALFAGCRVSASGQYDAGTGIYRLHEQPLSHNQGPGETAARG